MKAVAPNCTILVATAFFIIMHVRLNKQKQNPPFSLKNVLDAAIKFINFIKSQPLNTHFLIFCLTNATYQNTNLSCKLNQPCFSRNIIFTRKNNRQTNYDYYSGEHLCRLFSQKWTLFFISKKTTKKYMLPMIKLKHSSKNRKENLHLPPWAWQPLKT